MRVQDSVHRGLERYLTRALETAAREKSPAVLIELDTPGGYLDATRGIVQLLLNSQIPVLVWVTPEGAHAASAGAMITMAAHYAAMSPHTSIGAATPISTGGDLGKDLKAKVENDTVAFVEGIAEKRGRNKEWARDAVVKASSVNATDALKEKVIDGIHSSREDVWAGFIAKKGGTLPTQVSFRELAPNASETFLGFISNPNIVYGLFTLGGLGIYLELSHPGTIIPGAVGALSLILGAVTMDILPIRPAAIGLLLLGIALLALELLTPIPSYGVLGLGGAASLFLSGIFLLDPAETNLRLSSEFWLPIFAAVVGFMVFIGYQAGRAIRATPYAQGAEGLVGKSGKVVTSEGATARILVQGELWNAQSKSAAALTKDQIVTIVAQDGLTVFVEPSRDAEVKRSV